MSHAAHPCISGLLDQSERDDTCAHASDGRLRRSLARARQRGELHSPYPGLYVRKTHWESLDRGARELYVLRCLAKLHPQWTYCQASAALVHGLYVSWPRLERIHLAQTPEQRGHSTASIQRHRIADVERQVIGNIPVTPLLQTAADCLRAFGEEDGLAIADSVARRLGLSAEKLADRVYPLVRGRTGGARARAVTALADARSESGGESIARMVMIKNGFLVPELQREIPNPMDPLHPYRVDFYWVLPDGRIVIGELDGLEKRQRREMTRGRTQEEISADERLRESRISALTGARFMRFTFQDVRHPERLVSLMESFGIPRAT